MAWAGHKHLGCQPRAEATGLQKRLSYLSVPGFLLRSCVSLKRTTFGMDQWIS